MKANARLSIVLFSLFVYLFLSAKAHAYLDPGSGSYIFQLIVAALFGALFGIKIFWSRIKQFFVNLFSRNKINNNKEDERK